MKKTISLFILACVATFASAQWTAHLSYQKLRDALKDKDVTYALYEGRRDGLNTERGGNLLKFDGTETKLFSKADGLAEKEIVLMDYDLEDRQLVLVYSNGNIDLVGKGITNFPVYKNNPDATIMLNGLTVQGRDAFISTAYGVMWLDLKETVVRGYYKLGATSDARLVDNVLYARLKSGVVKSCSVKNNLQDLSQWTSVGAMPERNDKFQCTHLNGEELETLSKQLGTFGPELDYPHIVTWAGNRLLVAGGLLSYQGLWHYYHAMMYEDGKWTVFSKDFTKDPHPFDATAKWVYERDATSVAQDPFDSEHHFVGTLRAGIFEYKNNKFVNRYSVKNSPLASALPAPDSVAVRACALTFDKEGNLWAANVNTETVIVIRKANGQWTQIYDMALNGCTQADYALFDKKGRYWLADRRYAGAHKGGLYCLDFNKTIDNTKDDKSRFRSDFINEDGTPVNVTACYCVTEDKNGQIWFGTDQGLLVVEDPDEWFNDDFLVTQIKVPRNDGTDYADYLLAGIDITCIAVDPANRKWIGTATNGIYLVSADGIETIHHFTQDNSPLLSDHVFSVDVNGQTGEVMIGTDKGLISYAGDATEPTETLNSDNLLIYPNPLRPENPNVVTIQGLADNTEVKITTVGGQVVDRGVSMGGSYKWDTTNLAGERVPSGIYYIMASDANGKKGATGKVAVIR